MKHKFFLPTSCLAVVAAALFWAFSVPVTYADGVGGNKLRVVFSDTGGYDSVEVWVGYLVVEYELKDGEYVHKSTSQVGVHSDDKVGATYAPCGNAGEWVACIDEYEPKPDSPPPPGFVSEIVFAEITDDGETRTESGGTTQELGPLAPCPCFD